MRQFEKKKKIKKKLVVMIVLRELCVNFWRKGTKRGQ